MQGHIDSNIKGVRKEKPHFHSLVISPSREELSLLEGDERHLKDYTRQVMENYAANFKDRHQKPVKGEEVVWYATIHRNRHYSGLDDEVQTGEAKPRQKKEGEQTHIHVIVSARDQTMSRSLHPDSGSRRFNYDAWLTKNREDFNQSFGYKPVVTESQHQQRLEKQINRLERGGLLLDRDQTMDLGRSQNYSPEFWKRMKEVERGAKRGDIFTPRQAYERLIENPDSKEAKTIKTEEKSISAAKSTTAESKTKSVESQVADPKKAKTEGIENKSDRIVEGTDKKSESTIDQKFRPIRVDITPLIAALRFDSVPNTGGHATSKDDDFRRRVRRRR